MRKYNFLSGLFLMILSVGTCFIAHRLGLGNIHNPGPGLIPFGVAVILLLMSLGLILRSFFEAIKGPQKKEVFKGVDWKRVVLVLGSLLGYGIAFNFLGFPICTFLLMILLLGVVGRLKWWLTLFISLFTVLCTYLIFVVWLECPFPKGPFGIG
jgi:putative tricarboxylic transport membrane protein